MPQPPLLIVPVSERVILLPLGAAKQLRNDEAVVYLQRIWMGEPLDDWDETYSKSSAPSGRVPKAESDTNLQWGPKAFPFGTTATRTYQEQLDWANNHIDAIRFAGHWRDYLGALVDN